MPSADNGFKPGPAHFNYRHGMAKKHPAYSSWTGMRNRCNNPNNVAYPAYGGRGIIVCSEWNSDFTAFWRDMEDGWRPGLTVERIDVNGNYEPSNCCWATREAQGKNRRNTIRVHTPWGEMSLVDVAARIGMNYSSVRDRYNKGLRGERLCAAPDPQKRTTLGMSFPKGPRLPRTPA